MQDDLRVVFESRNRQSCTDRALVLAASRIPHQMIDDGCQRPHWSYPPKYSARAVEELQLYDDENPPLPPKPATEIVYQDALPGVVGLRAGHQRDRLAGSACRHVRIRLVRRRSR